MKITSYKNTVVIFRLIQSLFILIYLPFNLLAIDVDEDGVDDEFESRLIEKFRPELIYDSRNTFWPSTVLWYVQQCDLLAPDCIGYIPNEFISQNPLVILNRYGLCGQITHDGYFSSIESKARLHPYGDGHGQGTDDAHGMYAHCFRITQSYYYQQRADIPVGKPGDYVVQYLQFFPYNDSPVESCCHAWCPGLCHWGDHEGDWLYLDVFVDGTTWTLRNVVYHHHGDGNCAVDILPGEYPLPADGIPQCYLESNTHEWWPLPQAFDCYSTFADPPNGLGWRVRPHEIKNIGERFRPTADVEAQLIVLYNGLWGDYAGDQFATPADSPLFQQALLIPTDTGFLIAPRWIVHMSPTGTNDASIPKHLGSVYSPCKKLDEAGQIVEPSGTIRCQAGTYSVGGGVTISRPATITTDGSGSVVFQ
jgi:hypothetical protein